MDKADILKQINEGMHQTMTTHIGIEITDFGDDFLCGKMPVDNRTTQPYGLLHGGASAAFAETLCSVAGGMKMFGENKGVVGIEINANHLKSVKSGWVYGRAIPVRVGRKIQVWDIKITNEEDELVCVSRLTLAVVEKPS